MGTGATKMIYCVYVISLIEVYLVRAVCCVWDYFIAMRKSVCLSRCDTNVRAYLQHATVFGTRLFLSFYLKQKGKKEEEEIYFTVMWRHLLPNFVISFYF